MHSCHLAVLLLAFLFQSVRCNQNAAFDKNYSDRLTAANNDQQSTLQSNNKAYHATIASGLNRFAATALHETSHPAASAQHYETSRFRRSSSIDDSNSGSSMETGPTLNGGTMPEDNDSDVKKPINFLRLYFCGPGYQNCMYDDRLNNIQVQNEFLKQIPNMAQLTIPSNYVDWKSKQMSLPTKAANSPLGRRDRSFTADEPRYVLVRSDDAGARNLAMLSGPDFMDDPFIPQRGRRQSNAQSYDDPFYPMRGRRADKQTWDDPFFPMRGKRADKPNYDDPFFPMRGRRADKPNWDDPFFPMRGRRADAQAWDDPFFPMRGRRADKNSNAWDDPFIPMRGRRSPKDSGKRAKPQPWDDPFIPMRGRRWPTKSLAYDDPFIPMRGRKSDSDYDDTFIPMRGRRSIQTQKAAERRKRSLLASTGTFNAVYTPSEEVIVKLNGVQDNNNKNSHSLPSNHLFSRQPQHNIKSASPLIEGTTSHSALNAKHQQHQKKSYFSLDNFATNPDDDGDNGLMNDYATDYYVESPPQTNKSRWSENNKQRWMKSSRDLSQNRDAGNLARGSGTSLAF